MQSAEKNLQVEEQKERYRGHKLQEIENCWKTRSKLQLTGSSTPAEIKNLAFISHFQRVCEDIWKLCVFFQLNACKM